MRLTRRRGEDGAIAIIVAFLVLVLCVLAAFVVDYGFAREIRAQLQTAADSGALAGAQSLAGGASPSVAAAAAKQAVDVDMTGHPISWATCSGTDWSPCITVTKAPGASVYTDVEVVLPSQHVPSFFGGVVGSGGSDVGGSAKASIATTSPVCALCVTGDVRIAGNGIQVSGGSVEVDGACCGDGPLTAPGDVVETVTPPNPMSGVPQGAVTLSPPWSNPFTGIDSQVKTLYGRPVDTDPSGSCTVGGDGIAVYPNVNQCSSFDPGVYVVTGGSHIHGTASDVTFIFACAEGGVVVDCATHPTGSRGHYQGSSSGGALTLTAGSQAPYAGFAMISAPGNDDCGHFVGDHSAITGTIYGRDLHFDMVGTGDNRCDVGESIPSDQPLLIYGRVVVAHVDADVAERMMRITAPPSEEVTTTTPHLVPTS